MRTCSRRRARVLLLFTSVLLAACGTDAPSGQEVPPPDARKGDVELSWTMEFGRGGRPRYGMDWHLVLEPRGTFTLSWRRSGQSAPKEIRGKWQTLETGGWELRPDEGRAALKPGAYGQDEWPKLHLVDSGPTAAPDDSRWKFEVPVVDEKTGSFDDTAFTLHDPRHSTAPAFRLGDGILRQYLDD